MLVVDRVVLPAFDQPEQVREFQRDQAVVLDQRTQAGRETPDVGYMGEDVVRRHQVGPAVLLSDLAAGVGAQELDLRRNAPGSGRLGHVRGRLDTEHRDALGLEMLQQIAVVAGHLGDKTVTGQAETGDHRLRVQLRVRHPGVGIRGEVRVVGKNILAGYIGGKLHEKTGVAQPHMERIEGLRIVQPLLGDIAFTQRRHAEIDERTRKLRTAQAALMRQ